jgi:hypothetical protein
MQVLWIWVFSFFFLILDFGLLTCYFAGGFWWALVAAVAEFLFLGEFFFHIFMIGLLLLFLMQYKFPAGLYSPGLFFLDIDILVICN